MKMDAGYDKMNIIFRIFCVYDEPSAGKALPQTIIFTLDKMISFKKEKNYGFN